MMNRDSPFASYGSPFDEYNTGPAMCNGRSAAAELENMRDEDLGAVMQRGHQRAAMVGGGGCMSAKEKQAAAAAYRKKHHMNDKDHHTSWWLKALGIIVLLLFLWWLVSMMTKGSYGGKTSSSSSSSYGKRPASTGSYGRNGTGNCPGGWCGDETESGVDAGETATSGAVTSRRAAPRNVKFQRDTTTTVNSGRQAATEEGNTMGNSANSEPTGLGKYLDQLSRKAQAPQGQRTSPNSEAAGGMTGGGRYGTMGNSAYYGANQTSGAVTSRQSSNTLPADTTSQ